MSSSTENKEVVHLKMGNMVYANLGNSGLKVSKFSIGSWLTHGGTVHGDPVVETLKIALENGINFFDNAETYAAGKAELAWGKAFKTLGTPREEVVISTKIFFGSKADKRTINEWGCSRKHIVEGLRASLKRLQLEYVDIVMAHRPDVATPIEETVRAFNWCIDQGLAFYWGTSEWTAEQITEAINIADRLNMIRPICDQAHFSLLHPGKVNGEYQGIFKKYGYGTTIWSPLESGQLTGKYVDGVPKGSRYDTNSEFFKETVAKLNSPEGKATTEKVKKLMALAEEIGTTATLVSLAWTIKHPNVSTAILGASTPEQLTENLKALDILDKLTPEVMDKLEKIFDNKPVAEVTYGRA